MIPKRIVLSFKRRVRAPARPAGKKRRHRGPSGVFSVEAFEAARKENTEPGKRGIGDSAGISLAGKHPGAGKPHQENRGGWQRRRGPAGSSHGAGAAGEKAGKKRNFVAEDFRQNGFPGERKRAEFVRRSN